MLINKEKKIMTNKYQKKEKNQAYTLIISNIYII